MNLYPQDLREDLHVDVLWHRSGLITQIPALIKRPETTPHLGILGRTWVRKLPVSQKQAAMAMPLAAGSAIVLAWGFQIVLSLIAFIVAGVLGGTGAVSALEAWGLVALTVTAITYLSFVVWPRAAIRKLYKKPLSVREMENSGSKTTTGLPSSYLSLVQTAILQPVPAEAQDDVRAAIRSLGEAIDALPLVESPNSDSEALRQEASALRAEAMTETDTIVAESLGHQSEALLRRAEAADRSGLYFRRIATLRREIGAQIAAVQEDLSTFNSADGALIDRAALSHLSEGARRVAAISISAASARAELDSYQLPRIRQTALAAEEPSVQTVQNL